MNADIPYLHCWVDAREISDRHGCDEAYAFAVQSVRGRALGLHCMMRSGAHYRNVPLHAIWLRKDAGRLQAHDLAYWDCLSSRPIVTVFDYLREHEALALMPSGSRQRGTYLFTVDWLPDDACHPGFIAEPDQNKCGHVLALDSGHICMLPTNKIAWRDGYWIGANPAPHAAGYKVQTSVYHAERADQDFSKSDSYFY